jgi:hypothetical protein
MPPEYVEGRPAGGVDEVEALEQRGGAPAAPDPVEPVQIGHEHQVLLAGEEVVDGGELAGDADRSANGVGVLGGVVAGDAHGAGVGLDEG